MLTDKQLEEVGDLLEEGGLSHAEIDSYLAHYGVKGMKWGQRRTNRDARRDAEETARAKMFYGEGAGTRRKLIKATVEAKSKKDPAYAAAFEKHLNNQDMGAHASKARGERGRKDFKDRNTKRAGYVARRLTGEMGTQAAFTAAVIGGAAFLNSPRGRTMMSKAYNSASSAAARKRGAYLINKIIKNSL